MSTTIRPTTVRLLAAVASLLLVSALIVRTTDAAFTAETTNSGNTFQAAVVGLTADDADPMFLIDETGTSATMAGSLVPGQTVESCIVITYTGDVAATDVVLSYDETLAGGPLLSSLDVSVESFAASSCGTAGTGTAVATGGLDAAISSATGWSPDTTDTQRAFLFAVTLDAAADDSLQSATASGVAFTWSTSSS